MPYGVELVFSTQPAMAGSEQSSREPSNAKKKQFVIPSIDDIDKYEKHKPKLPSNFKSRNTAGLQQASTSGSTTDVNKAADGFPSNPTSAGSAFKPPLPANQNVTAGDHGKKESFGAPADGGRVPLPHSTNDEEIRGGNVDGGEAGTSGTSTKLSAPVVATSSASAPENNTAPAGVSRPGGPRVQFTSAADFVRKRGKIGASFADKFRMLGSADEYKVPLQAIKQSSLGVGSAEPGTASAAGTSKAASGNSVIVNPRQRGNPILKHIRNVPWEFGDIVPDYVMGRATCAFYLSLRYHHLNPNYIHDRLMELGHKFDLRVLLVQVDVKDPHHSVKELARLAILADCTLILAWSSEEAGRYLETYKAYENKPADALKERVEQDHVSKMTDCLTSVKAVNRTDVITLLANYGTFEKIIDASKEELALLPGFGPQKAQRLSNIFTEPFLRRNKRRKVQKEEKVAKEEAEEQEEQQGDEEDVR